MCVDKIFNLRWYDDDIWLCNVENLLFKYETNQMMFNYRCCRIANDDNFTICWIRNESEFVELDKRTCECVNTLTSLPLAYELLIITLLPYGNNHVFKSIISSFYGLKPISKAIDETFYCCCCHHFVQHNPTKFNCCQACWKTHLNGLHGIYLVLCCTR